jgi:polysaccharide biosynthesis/export protein
MKEALVGPAQRGQTGLDARLDRREGCIEASVMESEVLPSEKSKSSNLSPEDLRIARLRVPSALRNTSSRTISDPSMTSSGFGTGSNLLFGMKPEDIRSRRMLNPPDQPHRRSAPGGWGRFFAASLASLLLIHGVTAQGEQSAESVQAASVTGSTVNAGRASASVDNAGTVAPEKSEPDPNAYIIGEQDALVITVWKEKEISGGVVVRPDGKITVPLVGEIKAVGMTPVQLQSVLAEKLKPFVTVPQVTVAVTEIRSRKVYLIGHAAREGPFMINSSTTILQLIAQAGGLKDFAKRKKIYILRQNGKEQLHIPFNYNDAIKGTRPEQNILLEPGDTIVVP